MKTHNKAQKKDESSEDEEDSEQSNEIDTDNSPKVIPVAKLPDKLRTKKIIINISDTQYPVIEEVAEDLGWVIQEKQGAGEWDVWWTDREISPDVLFRMNLHQKINHFPGIYVLARKNMLGLNLMAMKEKFPEEYNFFPETWVIPIQFSQFQTSYQEGRHGKARTYIVKPQALSQGRGIFLTRNIEEIMTGHKYVVQRYIKNPFLIQGLKFDLRIYVLLAGSDPLQLYVYEDGLARFATERYQEPNQQNLGKAYVHLTNYSLNKNNPHYIYNTSENDLNRGHKRTLKALYQTLEKSGYDVEELKTNINQIIIKTIISGIPTVAHQYRFSQPEQYQSSMCFQILGFDIMLTSKLEPVLIEVNHTPSFEASTPLDMLVKRKLIEDTFKLMEITSQNKKILFQKAKLIIKKRIQTGKRQILKGKVREQLLKKVQEQRNKAFSDNKNGYKKIFPVQDEEQMKNYSQMLKRAEEVHKSTDQARRKLMKEEQQKIKAKRKADLEEKKKSQPQKLKPSSGKESKYFQKNEQKMKIENKICVATHKNGQYCQEKIKVQKKLQIKQSKKRNPKNEINDKGQGKLLNIRSKSRNKSLNPEQQLKKLSEVMMKILPKKDLLNEKNSDAKDDELHFLKMKQSLNKKNRPLLTPVLGKSKQKQSEDSQKGSFLKPRTYQILYQQSAQATELNRRLHETYTSEIFKKREIMDHHQYLKNCYKKKKRPSLY